MRERVQAQVPASGQVRGREPERAPGPVARAPEQAVPGREPDPVWGPESESESARGRARGGAGAGVGVGAGAGFRGGRTGRGFLDEADSASDAPPRTTAQAQTLTRTILKRRTGG